MINGDDLIDLAADLITSSVARPAARRAAVSRAYYGAYHLTLEFLLSLGFQVAKEHNLHRDLYNCGQAAAQRAGSILDDLYARRRHADYELKRDDIERPAYAQVTLALAREFQEHIEKCRHEPLRGAVKAGIEAYRQRIGPRA